MAARCASKPQFSRERAFAVKPAFAQQRKTPNSRYSSGMSHVAVENALGLDQQVSCSGRCISVSPDLTCLVAQLSKFCFFLPVSLGGSGRRVRVSRGPGGTGCFAGSARAGCSSSSAPFAVLSLARSQWRLLCLCAGELRGRGRAHSGARARTLVD